MQHDPLTGVASMAPVLDGGAEAAITPKGRLEAATNALGPVAAPLQDFSPEYFEGIELTDANRQDLPQLARLRRERGMPIESGSPEEDLAAAARLTQAQEQADNPKAYLAETRRDLVQKLQDEVYGPRGMDIPDAYNIPLEERGIYGKLGRAMADIQQMRPESWDNPIDRRWRESTRKKKVDPTPDYPWYKGMHALGEKVTYPTRAVIDSVLGTNISQDLESLEGQSIPGLETDKMRAEILGRDRTYGLRSLDEIDAELKPLKAEYDRVNALEIHQDQAFNPSLRTRLEKQLKTIGWSRSDAAAVAERDKQLQKLKNRMDAIRDERTLIEDYLRNQR